MTDVTLPKMKMAWFTQDSKHCVVKSPSSREYLCCIQSGSTLANAPPCAKWIDYERSVACEGENDENQHIFLRKPLLCVSLHKATPTYCYLATWMLLIHPNHSEELPKRQGWTPWVSLTKLKHNLQRVPVDTNQNFRSILKCNLLYTGFKLNSILQFSYPRAWLPCHHSRQPLPTKVIGRDT